MQTCCTNAASIITVFKDGWNCAEVSVPEWSLRYKETTSHPGNPQPHTSTLERGWEMKNTTSVRHFLQSSPRQLLRGGYRLLNPPWGTVNPSLLYGEPVGLIYAPYPRIWDRYFLWTGIPSTDQHQRHAPRRKSLPSARESWHFAATAPAVTETPSSQTPGLLLPTGFHLRWWRKSLDFTSLPKKTQIPHSNLLTDLWRPTTDYVLQQGTKNVLKMTYYIERLKGWS